MSKRKASRQASRKASRKASRQVRRKARRKARRRVQEKGKLIERNTPPRGGFLFTMFLYQEPCVRGPPSKNLVQILRGGSSYTRFLMREHSKYETPPGGGGVLSIKVERQEQVDASSKSTSPERHMERQVACLLETPTCSCLSTCAFRRTCFTPVLLHSSCVSRMKETRASTCLHQHVDDV